MHLLEGFLSFDGPLQDDRELLKFFKSLSNLEVGGWRLYDGSHSHWMQNPNEFLGLVLLLRSLHRSDHFPMTSLLEIGYASGITHTLLYKLLGCSRSVAIDDCSPGGRSPAAFVANLRNKNLIFVPGDSRSEFSRQVMGSHAPYDVIHVDGGHTYDVAYQDLALATELLGETGVIAVHDIRASYPVEVQQVWEDFAPPGEYTKLEILDPTASIKYGIGVVIKGASEGIVSAAVRECTSNMAMPTSTRVQGP